MNTEDLKEIAGSRCIAIYEDFDEAEIGKETTSVRLAWECGKELKAASQQGSQADRAGVAEIPCSPKLCKHCGAEACWDRAPGSLL